MNDNHHLNASAQILQTTQRARQARHLKWWQRAAVAVALFPPLLSLIFAWQRTGELPVASLLVWLAVMVFMTVFGWLRTPR
mgnify:CR=1 FL=1